MSIEYFDTSVIVYFCILLGILGAAFGSFMNCVADRLVHGENWMKGRSHCDECGHLLGFFDLIPIVSYLVHKGKCKYCGTKIPVDCLYTECFMAFVFIVLFLCFGFTMQTVQYMGLSCFLLGLSMVDLRIYEIPDGFHIAMIIWWIITMPFTSASITTTLITGLIGGFGMGIMLLMLSYLFEKVSKKDGLGGGDIKLFFVIGLYLGILPSLLNLFISCIIGLLFVVILKKEKIPFGPSISLATLVTVLFGGQMIAWYLSLF